MGVFFHSISLGLIFLASLGAFFAQGKTPALSVFCGMGLMYLNFVLLHKIGHMIFTSKDTGSQAKGGVLMLLKLLGLFAAAYICLTYLNLDGIWFGLAAAGMILTISLITVKEQSQMDINSAESETFEQ